VAAPPATAPGPEDDAVVSTPPTLEDEPPLVDEAAEAAFLGEAKERGEVVPKRSEAESEDETPRKALPPLDELVQRIPADVRDTLEDLFRARFTTVKRFPKKALK